MTTGDELQRLDRELIECRRCPRLVAWREQVAREKRAAFRHWDYWGRPVPGFGDPAARLLVLGLAPAAHGGNRTGRIFTGDRSGDWLFASLWRTGFANQPTSVSRDDGLELRDCYVTAPVKCAPPDNKPLPQERANCAPWLERHAARQLPRQPAEHLDRPPHPGHARRRLRPRAGAADALTGPWSHGTDRLMGRPGNSVQRWCAQMAKRSVSLASSI